MYKYKEDWFLSSEIKQLLLRVLHDKQKNTVLEIGCFEGLSSVYFADNVLDNVHSSLTCVDPFLNVPDNDHAKYINDTTESNFDYNISVCKNNDKITVHKITSDDFFKINDKTYNFIYIDGCHEPEYIKRDMENSFKVLDVYGVMWMDDYRGGDGIKIKNTMDNFLNEYKGQYRLVHQGYQLAIQKITTHS